MIGATVIGKRLIVMTEEDGVHVRIYEDGRTKFKGKILEAHIEETGRILNQSPESVLDDIRRAVCGEKGYEMELNQETMTIDWYKLALSDECQIHLGRCQVVSIEDDDMNVIELLVSGFAMSQCHLDKIAVLEKRNSELEKRITELADIKIRTEDELYGKFAAFIDGLPYDVFGEKDPCEKRKRRKN